MGLLTEYPAWFILFCLLLGAIYVFFLYFRSDKESIPPWLRLFLEFLRFAAIFLISFLLLSPLFRQNLTTIEKPVIVIGQDNSQSLILGSDSAFIRGEYVNRLNELVAKLENQYDVRTYSFGDRVTSPMNNGFDEKRTDISHFFSEISASYENRNLGAIILASDGICNFGTDPYYTARDLSYPIYTIALGDTTSHRDSRIAHVLFNSQIFLGDDFPVEIQVDANHCDGENASLVVKENSRVVDSCQIPVKGNRFSRQIPVLLEAKQPGWHRYSIELSPINQEVTLENNRQDIFIEVLDMRTKVLIVHDAPHPDIGALKEALERNEKFEVVMRRPEEFLLSND
ncbi:MAG: hypothetical protein JXA23_07970, partial [Bacteroidales bacterium]|nr:hypothetical protein [Bacteroidales bacterium]